MKRFSLKKHADETCKLRFCQRILSLRFIAFLSILVLITNQNMLLHTVTVANRKQMQSPAERLERSTRLLKDLLEPTQLDLFKKKNKGKPIYFDIGLSDGKDSAYHLSKGYSVIGVDAFKPWIDEAKEKFAVEIDDHRALFFNVGLSIEDAEAMELYFKEEGSVVSSFVKKKACKGIFGDDPRCKSVKVPVVRCDALLSLVEMPAEFVKIDIEMMHHSCVRALNKLPTSLLPNTVCWEEHDIPFGTAGIQRPLTDAKLILGMSELGYNRIKLVLLGEAAYMYYGIPKEKTGGGQQSGNISPDEMMHYRSFEKEGNNGKFDTEWRTVSKVFNEGLYHYPSSQLQYIRNIVYYDICMRLDPGSENLRETLSKPENFPLSSYANK